MSSSAFDLLLIVSAGLLGGMIARALRQPLVIGYILAGVAVGPYTPFLATVSNIEQVGNLADVGAALLLFSLGLEFPLKSMTAIRGVAFYGAAIQVAITFFLVVLLGRDWGFSSRESMYLGAAMVSSSTAVILKTLTSRGLSRSLSGRVMLGMSIVQDLMVIPIMIILANWHGEVTAMAFAKPVIGALAFVAAMVFAGSRLLRWLLHFVARLDSRELFLLTITALALGVGALTNALGLSFAFGAFAAGMVLSESDFNHQAVSEMVPLRDIFGLIFFVAAGMLLDPVFLWKNLQTILSLTFLVTFARGVILAGVTYSFGYRRIVPLAALFGMLPISELAFVLIRLGKSSGAVQDEMYNLILNATILSMLAGPFIAGLTGPVYQLFSRRFSRIREDVILKNLPPDKKLCEHVIVVGSPYAPFLSSALREAGLRYLVIEPEYRSFQMLQSTGHPVIYGDPGQESVLLSAGADAARAVVISGNGSMESTRIIHAVRKIGGEVAIFVEGHRFEDVEPLREAGADTVACPSLEVQKAMLRQLFVRLNVDRKTISLCEKRLRCGDWGSTEGIFSRKG